MNPIPWILLVILVLACVQDTERLTIANGFSVAVLVTGSLGKGLGFVGVPWSSMFLGLGAAFAAALSFYALGGLGGADVKLLAALGFCSGLSALPMLLLATALAGGALGLLAHLRGRREFAYGPAIAAGWLVHTISEHLA